MSTSIKINDLSVSYRYTDPDKNNIRNHIIKILNPKLNSTNNHVKYVSALKNISLEISNGERVGLIGTNGSGKTTLLKIIAHVLYPTAGNITIEGHVTSIFDPSLGMDPEASGLENIRIRCMLLGVSNKEIEDKVKYISTFSELGDALSRPVKTYSAGMGMRLAFAIATSVKPEILVMDEWLSAGDARFVSKALTKMQELISSSQILVIASHSEAVLTEWCNRLIWINNGQVAGDGHPIDVLEKYHSHVACLEPA